MIRQAISCDICGTEKRQSNHWFVAYEQGAELRVSEWNARSRLRPGTRHLCGQTCLHKLMDDYMARTIAVRPSQASVDDMADPMRAMPTDTSLTLAADDLEFESSARLLTPVAPVVPVAPRPVTHIPAELVAVAAKPHVVEQAPPLDESSRYTSRHWRAEAWERERERTQHTADCRPEIMRRQFRA